MAHSAGFPRDKLFREISIHLDKFGAPVKILLAADGSIYTRHAVKYLIGNRAMFGAEPVVHLLNVRPPLPGRVARALARAMVNRYYREETEKALVGTKQVLDRERIAYKEVALVGDPGAAIASYAERGKFSLVIMGSHGQGALKGLVLGSVATKVLANCKVPVLIVR
jgi:nucleotide-binding universal stress UspA family protein